MIYGNLQVFSVIGSNWIVEIDMFNEMIIVVIMGIGNNYVVERVFFGVVMGKMDNNYCYIFVSWKKDLELQCFNKEK